LQQRTAKGADKPLEQKKREAEHLVRSFVDFLRQNYPLTNTELHTIIEETQEELKIPNTILHNKPLSPLECIVKFLKENCSLSYRAIADSLQRDHRTVWVTYRNAAAKQKGPLTIGTPSIHIPVSVLCSKRTIFESIVVYLKDAVKKGFHDIGILLQRDERNIWATYHRAKKKHG